MVRMSEDDQPEDHETEVAVPHVGVQGFSPAALRRARGRRRLSLRQLSLLSAVSAATISSWESGKAAPSARLLAPVAEALEIEIGTLVPVKEARLVLVDLRNQWGLNQQEAADLVGLKRSMFAAIETGFRAADQAQRSRIADLYEITDEDFKIFWQRTRDTRIARLKAR